MQKTTLGDVFVCLLEAQNSWKPGSSGLLISKTKKKSQSGWEPEQVWMLDEGQLICAIVVLCRSPEGGKGCAASLLHLPPRLHQ